MARILIVEDEEKIARFVTLELEHEGYQVEHAADGRTAVDLALERDYDLILLDVLLPQLNGMEVLRRVRKHKDVPVIMVTARDAVMDKVAGLDAGADDYLTKPFDRAELLARIQAVVRRSKGHANSVIRTGDVEVNLDTQTVSVNGETLHLTGKEYGIMELLSLRKGSTLNKDQFLNHLYGGIDEPELKIIDVFICKLRKKLEKASGGKNYIETVWGRGYVLRDPDEKI